MRMFFLLLLVSNVLFMLWQLQYSEQPEHQQLPSPGREADNGLTLLSELEQDERTRLGETDTANKAARAKLDKHNVQLEVNKPEARESADTSMRCMRIGGFEKSEERDAFSRKLGEVGATVFGVGDKPGIKRLYWVLLPPHKSHVEAAASADSLRRNKVRDFFIVRSGEDENAVSLGVFSSEERAQLRQQQIASLKADLKTPVVRLRESEITLYWTEFGIVITEQDKLNELLDEYKAAISEEIRCK